MLQPVTVGIMLVICINFISADDASSSYAKVVTLGSNGDKESWQGDSGPKLFKALHTDLNIPVSTTKTIETTASGQDKDSSLGRAYTYINPYRIYPRRQYSVNKNRSPSVIYPRYGSSYKRIDQAMDRYTPGEAVATAQFKKNKDGYNYNPPKMKPTRPSAISYTPPKDLYAFPPNLDSNYLPPTQPPPSKPRKPITSYIPPPAGAPSGFVGPVNPEYLPPFMKESKSEDKGKPADSDTTEMPASNPSDDMLPPLTDSENPPSSETEMSAEKDMPPNESSDEMGKPDMEDDMLSHIESPDMPDMPVMDEKPSSMDDHPDSDFVPPGDHDHFHLHGGHSFYGSHGVDAFPEIIYDDHDHHHFHHDHPPPIVVTTTTAKPEPPPEPRVKKYSYFYLGRKLWYIPLYFTVWFSFYIFWLIVKSIARHKVNLPNHYTGRMMKRDLTEYFTHRETMENINDLTVRVIEYIEDFGKKYPNSATS
ncbi:unnamed protein product [Hermetia illucens]|uniref:Uncharacterized protein n=1 Tax=Hermetia illucens TaxID=343691 RepID=A0A7R8YU50_HERIL|nr:uncharacterized protein LOC119652278 [Hermetia illucens]CAD7085442.1 unnamed protein product [Hermetia illucens]